MPVARNVRCSLCLLLAVLAACGGTPRAPVEDRQSPASSARPPVMSSQQAEAPGTYRVRRGDTLYSIAWRHGLDFRALARANAIPAPYTIYPGQPLRLREAGGTTSAAPARPAPEPAAPAPRQPQPVASPARPAVTPRSSAPATNEGALGPVSAWRWPAEGKVVRRYSTSVHKGIDIAGNRGEPVRAVADGIVVYAGTGIVGFGELLIVKHNDIYLSAYGHNDRLLASEGDRVSAGERIADKGSSGTDTVKLHFEIRRGGKPVDPLALLPRR